MNDEVRKKAFELGYRVALKTRSYWDLICEKRKQECADWDEFEKIAWRGQCKAFERLERTVKELDAQAEYAADAYINPTHGTFTSYPPVDVLGAIDAGVDELPATARAPVRAPARN